MTLLPRPSLEVVQPTELRIPNMIAVTSGKGGVGKTCLSVAISQALANHGRRVLLIDGDLGLANVDVQLGIAPKVNLGGVLAGRRRLEEAPLPFLKNLDIISGRSGSGSLGNVSMAQVMRLLVDLSSLATAYDTVVLDTATGISETSMAMCTPSGQLLMVLTDDPSSLTNAFAVTKRLCEARQDLSLRVLVNLAADRKQGLQTFETFKRASVSALGFAPSLVGIVSHDMAVPHAIRQQSPILSLFPKAKATQEIRGIVQKSL